jgi:hypothetical protein
MVLPPKENLQGKLSLAPFIPRRGFDAVPNGCSHDH